MPQNNIINFLLCPDRSSARRLRRIIAEQSPRSNVIVGTWQELVKHARDAYLLGEKESTWSADLTGAASSIPDAFWVKSLSLAQPETSGILSDALIQLLSALGPNNKLEDVKGEGLSSRGVKHFADLVRLHQQMEGSLPPELEEVNDVLTIKVEHALRKMMVYVLPGMPEMNPWQKALVAKLNQDCDASVDSSLMDVQKTLNDTNSSPSALSFLQGNLYTRSELTKELDSSLQWLAVRDYLQEAEVTAGMIQKLLDDSSDIKPQDIGLLLPEDARYAQAVREIFSNAGLPLAGMVEARSVRDLGNELIFYLLLSLNKPAPAMAFAAFLASPLLPWGRTNGLILAQQVMDGNFRLEKMDWPAEGKLILKQLVSGIETPQQLLGLLGLIDSGLPQDENLSGATEHARCQINSLSELVAERKDIPWEELLPQFAPSSNLQNIEGNIPLEGIAVFQEGQEAWRPVQQLFVLGFNDGHYPRPTGFSPVFCEADLERLKQTAGMEVKTSSDYSSERRQRFVRQIGSASNAIHFLMSRRDAFGKRLAPSASLTFMAKLFGVSEPEELICELDTEAGRQKAIGLALAERTSAQDPRPLEIADLDLGCDLLALQKTADGGIYPMSPSRLETLMVSPLAWTLGRSDLEPKEWAPEELDVASKGTLAHAVFEWLFTVGEELPDEETIRAKVPGLLNRAILNIKPFLLGAEWQVERNHLETEVLIAALKWRELLDELGARVVGVEAWLNGNLDGIPLHGAADLLLRLPNGRLYVVDYKKSKSKKRKERMQAAFDSQASLYRIMLETGGVTSKKSSDAEQAVKEATEIGVLYYLMNDQVALTDTNGWLKSGLDGVEELAGDVSSEALKLIKQRLLEVQHGKVCLNTEDDEKWYDKNAGLKLYALDNSPLLRLFMHPGMEEGK